jgi:hypothetical protein
MAMSHLQHITRPFLILVASIALAGAAYAAEPYEAFVSKYCIACHGPDQQEGELRIDQLSRDFALGGDTHRWAEVIERVNAGDMPPEGEPQPTQDEIGAFVSKLDSLIREGRAARMAARPPVSHYRLSRKEYRNTVYDLLGVHYDPTKPGQLNEDTLWHGYERIGLLQRQPTQAEFDRWQKFLSSYPGDDKEKWSALSRVLLASNEYLFVPS